jgi:hypothetical protein
MAVAKRFKKEGVDVGMGDVLHLTTKGRCLRQWRVRSCS